MTNLKKEITFFHTDNIEKLTTQNIANEANKRGYKVIQTNNLKEKAEIGFYCSHKPNPRKAKFSCIMLHDLGQRHDTWPHFWKHEPWSAFDLGFIPGNIWGNMFLDHPKTNKKVMPKKGLYQVGWPKSDIIFNNQEFQSQIEALKKQYDLSNKKTILYAPSWENNEKQTEFIDSFIKEDGFNLLIKQADWPKQYPTIIKNIEVMEKKYQNTKNIITMDRRLSIMLALGLADIIVSDESSVLVEALLFGIPSIGVEDWLIPDTSPPRFSCIPFDFVYKTKKKDLNASVKQLLEKGHFINYKGKKIPFQEYINQWFSNKGTSSKLIMDILEKTINKQEIFTGENLCTTLNTKSPSFSWHQLLPKKLVPPKK